MQYLNTQQAWAQTKKVEERLKLEEAEAVDTELVEIFDIIQTCINKGHYHTTKTIQMSKGASTKLIELGYSLKGSRGGGHIISWQKENDGSDGEVNSQHSEVDGVLELNFNEKGASLMDNIQEGEISFIKKLEETYPKTISFIKDHDGGFISGFNKRPYDVVLNEKGVRGPADWFYFNDDHRWAHGGYTGYDQTYDNVEFINMVKGVHEQNKEYGN